MDMTYIFNHIGYVVCFWGVWKVLDLTWQICGVDSFLHKWIDRGPIAEIEKVVAGKLQYYNSIRQKDETATRKAVLDLATSVVALSKRVDAYTNGLHAWTEPELRNSIKEIAVLLDKATDGLKFDVELTKEVEKLRKKIHELYKVMGEPTPCYLPELPVKTEVVNQDGVLVLSDSKKEKHSAKKKAPSLGKSQSEPLKYSIGNPQANLEQIRAESKAFQDAVVKGFSKRKMSSRDLQN